MTNRTHPKKKAVRVHSLGRRPPLPPRQIPLELPVRSLSSTACGPCQSVDGGHSSFPLPSLLPGCRYYRCPSLRCKRGFCVCVCSCVKYRPLKMPLTHIKT